MQQTEFPVLANDIWFCRDGTRSLIKHVSKNVAFVRRTNNTLDYAVSPHNGRVNSRCDDPLDLVSLDFRAAYGSEGAATKLSNPKEAMGDKKVPLWLCSTIAMAHWAAAQVAGLLKYGSWNWRAAGVRASTYLSAINRHLGRYSNGERLDPVDGTHHLGNIMACCAILLEAEAIGKLTDDRAPSADLQKTFDEVEGMIARLKEQYADRAPKHWTIEDTLP